MSRSPAVALKAEPPTGGAPAVQPPGDPRPASPNSGRKVVAGLLAGGLGLGILVAFALAEIYPLLASGIGAVTLGATAASLWAAARYDQSRLRHDFARLASDNGRLARELERLADTTWEMHESEEYRRLVDARQKAEAANQAKSRLLATVSHEFRTPLNGILGLTGLLRETGLSPDQETYARAVHSSGEALLALVDDMLDFSKVEAGRLDIHPEPVDPELLLEEIAELLAGRAHAKSIDIATVIAADVPARVMADPARLRQVLINLAGNGVKFTEKGGVTISIVTAGEGRLTFAVSDTGPGIPAKDAGRMFDEFEQLDTAPNRRHGGAGLGLAISRRIVRQMGGDISLDERPGGGSVFSFTVALPQAAPPTALPDLFGGSFLVLAPEGAEPPALARHLGGAGATVRITSSLNEAAALLGAAAAAGETHRAVFIDARIAHGAANALRRLHEAAGAPVASAVLIEPGRRGEVEGLRHAGFNGYLVRPVRRASLLRIAAELIAPEGGGAFRMDPGDARPAQPQAARRAVASLEVLVAEDNEINALLSRAVLEKLGHTVREVRDGAAALAAVRDNANGFAVILMDLHMPGVDGITAARAIREWEAAVRLPRAAILAVTADVLAETHETALAAGIDAILKKPMAPDALRRALADLTEPLGPGRA